MANSFFGAIRQFWTIDEKPRLYPKNSWFNDHQVSLKNGTRFLTIVTTLAIAIVVFASVGGIL